MSLLIDRLRAGPVLTPRYGCFSEEAYEEPARQQPKDIMEALQTAVPVSIQNVAEFYYETKFGKDGLSFADFPNLAPALECAFFEYRMTQSMHHTLFTNQEKVIGSFGVLVRGVEWSSVIGSWPEVTGLCPPGCRWFVAADLFIEQAYPKKLLMGPMSSTQLGVFPDGRPHSMCADKRWENYAAWWPRWIKLSWLESQLHDPDPALREYCQFLSGALACAADPVLFAMCLMHCKNVKVCDNTQPIPLSKKHLAKTGRPLVQFKTLEIEQMTKTLRGAGSAASVGLAKSLHLCRGHFKDYRQHGLFGKSKGLYWWDQHIRGSMESGVTVKDYAIKAQA